MLALNPWASYRPVVGDQIGLTYLYTGPVANVLPLLPMFKRLLDMRPGIQPREVRQVSPRVVYATVLVYRDEGSLLRQVAPAIHVGDGSFTVQAAVLLDERVSRVRAAAEGAADVVTESTVQHFDKALGTVAHALPESRTTMSLVLLGLGAAVYFAFLLNTRG